MNKRSSVNTLALHGGPKHINHAFSRYNPIGQEEVIAAKEVVESGILSQYLGCWDPDFFGGPKVQAFERSCEDYFKVKHAITFNSWTSGLVAAVGAIGTEPGDEIIVSPWTMAASATAILHWNAIPVFADIEPETFCLDPISVERNISPQTRAIMSVDIAGHSANMDALCEIARKHNLKIISDTAQAPAAKYKGKYAGTLADIGGFSLNYHKHIHTGEGGIAVTDDDDLADRLRLIRNHAEVVVEDKGVTNLNNMIGHNFRLGEIECAIGIEQLKKLDRMVASRQRIAAKLNSGLSGLEGLQLPSVLDDCTHVYYVYAMKLDIPKLGTSRQTIVEALTAEGVPALASSYQNLHLLPMYQQKIAYGSNGFPWTSSVCKREVSYSKGICPVAENLHESSFLGFGICSHEFTDEEVNLVIEAFHKVWSNLEALR
ncbi:DegT/DnrJ/EryC1/StrS family aminotransferase [Thalassospira xiamenensis]|uniref:dTDP-4-amino-4,6-dideoxygalactose transaminase n=1 Tax=Thalassospira xiamenensis TaxID=220697 RepID=A0A285TAE7_9PROT|nr:DegT/DnrJ/EryC1/StrS family aminotransferase [Thalassospira xiamenensis]SOC16703.1 dTDP-4-amino-4,6-dideoxygalactose transaminase [Thalassospira xiamenensis]